MSAYYSQISPFPILYTGAASVTGTDCRQLRSTADCIWRSAGAPKCRQSASETRRTYNNPKGGLYPSQIQLECATGADALGFIWPRIAVSLLMMFVVRRGQYWQLGGPKFGPYIWRISGWGSSNQLRIGLRSVGLTYLQYPTRVQPSKVGRVARSPDVMGEVLIRLRWSDFPLQSETGRRIEFKASCFKLSHHFNAKAPAAWHTARGRQIATKSGRTAAVRGPTAR
jgi:hypothetical protein